MKGEIFQAMVKIFQKFVRLRWEEKKFFSIGGHNRLEMSVIK